MNREKNVNVVIYIYYLFYPFLRVYLSIFVCKKINKVYSIFGDKESIFGLNLTKFLSIILCLWKHKMPDISTI